MSITRFLIVGVIATAVTFLLTPLVRNWTTNHGLLDQPDWRKVHKKAISRFGGVAMFAGFSIALAVQAAGERYFGWNAGMLKEGQPFIAVLGGLAIVFVVGLIDDVKNISPKWKLFGQLLAAGVVVTWGPKIDFIGDPFGGGLIAIGILSIPVTLIWIVGFTNVINLIDGLDGLAAGVSAIAAATFLLIADAQNAPAAAIIAAAVIGVCLGFLRFNFNPASIMMGDSGALFLGFALASIALLGVMKSIAAVALAVPLLVIGVPIFDTASAIIRRARHGQPIQAADRGHIHHRLLGRGFSQRQTVVIIYVWSILLAVGAFSMRSTPNIIRLVVFAVLAILSGFMAYWLGLFEAAHHQEE